MRLAYSRDLKSLKKWSENINNFKREKIKRFMQYLARMVRENYIYKYAPSGIELLEPLGRTIQQPICSIYK